MYGVTESEKYHLLSPVDLMHGMSEGQRDAVLKEHAKVRRLVTTRHDFFPPNFLGPLESRLFRGSWFIVEGEIGVRGKVFRIEIFVVRDIESWEIEAITKWRDISWSAGDARAWSGINPVQDSGTIRRFLARIRGGVHAEESRSRARGSIRQRHSRPLNNGRQLALEGESKQLHVRLRASQSDAGVLRRK